MKEFLVVSKKSNFYFILSLFITPILYFLSYFLTMVFFALFGEPIALTYVNILIFSFVYTGILFLVYYSGRIKAENLLIILIIYLLLLFLI